ncbi:class I SAM-dependent DNA methyltransferase [Actinomycetospora soli]|uniref:class I SAM-dependent DNA methyltransferase n=1 Tax=Actinomycetospora soli TaxID=2893887 RepID=UPI001E3E9A30|nr:class I SAM-dependent methyltransferase [Actinomycetospora soli]MCD2191691.1 class I SAM-dependent methyltransferase [Actinomycetospora soli]
MDDLPDWFGPAVAEDYDRDDDVRFTAEHLALESAFLADLAGERGCALEFAVGTGRIALPLRERGVEVHGIDLSEAMVARLRSKTPDVPVVVGDFTSTRVQGVFDLVYLVFNTIGNVTSQNAQVATFVNAARHLRAGGRFVVETQVPGVARVAPGERFGVFRHDTRGVGYDEFDRVTQQMWSHHVALGEGGRGERRSVPFRYAWPAELDLMARLAGMHLQQRWAWWDRAAFTDTSTSHVSVWARPD